MANTYKIRTKHKRDTSINWEKNNPILLDGELVLVDTVEGTLRKKVGDGESHYNDLPFDDQVVLDALKLKCDSSIAIDCVLLATGWANGQQSVDVNGVTSDLNGFVGLPQNYTGLQYEAVLSAELAVTGQDDGVLTFSVNAEVPQIDIPVTVILLG